MEEQGGKVVGNGFHKGGAGGGQRRTDLDDAERQRMLGVLRGKQEEILNKLSAQTFRSMVETTVRPAHRKHNSNMELLLREVETAIDHYSRAPGQVSESGDRQGRRWGHPLLLVTSDQVAEIAEVRVNVTEYMTY
jgi:hypothetical protein